MKSIIVLSLGVMTLFTSGCATVQRGTKMDIPIASNPSKAEVKLSTGQSGITPVTFTLKRNETVQVIISKEGYKTQTFTLSPVLSVGGVAAGGMNLILGGVVGIGVDAVSGANLDLSPDHIYAELEPLKEEIKSTEVKSPLNESQTAELKSLLLKMEETVDGTGLILGSIHLKNVQILEFGSGFRVKSIWGLSEAIYVGIRGRGQFRDGKETVQVGLVTIQNGKVVKVGFGSVEQNVNRPFGTLVRTVPVDLNPKA